MPKNGIDNCGSVKQFSATADASALPLDGNRNDVSFTNTTIAFNIEENRRRRAELANDVSELINISKYFQQSYANGYDVGDTSSFSAAQKSLDKKTKISANGKSIVRKSNKSSSCIAANRRENAGKTAYTIVNNAPGGIEIKNVIVGTQPAISHQSGDLPPIFDDEKLNEYCFDIVEGFFKKNKSADVSERNIKPKAKSTECVRHSVTLNGAKNESSMTQSTKHGTNKYASVSARYLNKCSNRKADEQPTKSVRNSWISARSKAILENVNRNGIEVKKHNCVAREMKNATASRSTPKKVQTQSNNRMLDDFRRIHPGIDLISSGSIFPRRAVKVSGQLSDSCSSITHSPRNHHDDDQPQAATDVVEPHGLNVNEIGDASALNEEMNSDDSKRQKQQVDTRSQLQFYEMPKITIAPKTECEISTVVTIDIQPNNAVRFEHRNRQPNNLKIVHCVHEATASDECNATANTVDNLTHQYSAPDEQSSNAVESNDEFLQSHSNQSHTNAILPTNKYYRPFLSESIEQRQAIVKAFDDETPLNDTSSSLVESVSINFSTTSNLSDKFASDALQRRNASKLLNRNPVESILNDIFENATLDIVAFDTNENAVHENEEATVSNSDAFQLRELLDKIRNDKTALDLAIERRNTMDSVSNAGKLLISSVVQENAISDEPTQIERGNVKVSSSKEDVIDKSIQCNVTAESVEKPEVAYYADDRVHRRTSKTRSKVKRDLHEHMLRSPKFAKTVNSIRLSARKLNFDGENGKYKAATPEQIQKAADKFLNSLIKGSSASQPVRRDDYSDSDSLNSYILAPKKYRVFDDTIIQSQYNNILLANSAINTSDSSIDPVHPLPMVKSIEEINESSSSSSIEFQLSKLSLTQEEQNESMHMTQNRRISIGNCGSNGNISDGEVLSEGEIRSEELKTFNS